MAKPLKCYDYFFISLDAFEAKIRYYRRISWNVILLAPHAALATMSGGESRDAKSCVSTWRTQNLASAMRMTMTDKFKDKYRSETTRLKGWNYASSGYYFVTACEKNRNCVFGDIANNCGSLTPLGLAAIECWLAIPKHFPFVELDEFCIMPNHVHGIIVISSEAAVETQNFASLQHGNTQNFASLQHGNTENKFGPQSKNLASIVRGFKIGVTKFARENDLPFAWQPRYHDRIIRDEQELFAVRTYIRNNPLEWALDEYTTNGINAACCRDAKTCGSPD